MPPPHTKITYTLGGSKIRLEYEDWVHIIGGHHEMIGHSEQILLTVNSPQEVYRDPLYPKKFKAFRYDERMGTYVMVIYVDYGEDGYIRTAYEVSDPWFGVQGWKKVGGLNQ